VVEGIDPGELGVGKKKEILMGYKCDGVSYFGCAVRTRLRTSSAES